MRKKSFPGLLLVALALVSFPSLSFASGGGGGGGRSGGSKSSSASSDKQRQTKSSDQSAAEAEDLAQRLKLTDPQKAQVQNILSARDSQIATLKQDKTLTKEVVKQRTQDIRDAANDKIRNMLTPDQQKTFDSSIHKGKKKKEEEKPAPATATPPATPGPTTP